MGLQTQRMGELGVGVYARQMINAAEEVHRIHGPLLNLFGFGVRGADHVAGLESTASDQDAEGVAMMVAPAIPRRLPVNFGAAAKLAGAPDQRALQQAVLDRKSTRL